MGWVAFDSRPSQICARNRDEDESDEFFQMTPGDYYALMAGAKAKASKVGQNGSFWGFHTANLTQAPDVSVPPSLF